MASTLNNLAYLLADSDPNLALAYAHRARQLMPDEPSVADTLGLDLFEVTNEPEKAIALFPRRGGEGPRDAPCFAIIWHSPWNKAATTIPRGKNPKRLLKSSPTKDEERADQRTTGQNQTALIKASASGWLKCPAAADRCLYHHRRFASGSASHDLERRS